jgi:hypothetical protein
MITRYIIPLLILITAALPLQAGPFPAMPATLKAGEESSVRGVINAVVFPISDDFEMEASQSGFALITPLPFAVKGTDDDGNVLDEANLTLFQLAGDETVIARCEALAGKPVEITAVLMHAHTRYHRTPFLLLINSVRAL